MVALLTNDCAFSCNLLRALLSKTIDAVTAKSLEDKMMLRLLQYNKEDDGGKFLVASSSSKEDRGGRFVRTSSSVNESTCNWCTTNADNDYDDNDGGGFMVASSPVNETVGNDNDDGGGGGFLSTSSCRKAPSRSLRARITNKETGSGNNNDNNNEADL